VTVLVLVLVVSTTGATAVAGGTSAQDGLDGASSTRGVLDSASSTPTGLEGTDVSRPDVVAPTGVAAGADVASPSAAATESAAARQEGAPDIEVSRETLRFSTGAYDSDVRTLAVRNVGDAPLTVRGIVIQGPDRAAFERAFDGPVTIEPGGRLAVDVSFEPAASGPRFGTMHVLSDDPDEPQVNVWLTNTRTVADVSPSRVLETRTLVNATVRDVEANTTQSLNLSWPLTRDDVVAVDALSFTPERGGDLRLSVATNESRFGDVPAFALADGTESAAFVHVDHTIANRDVRNVTFTVRVRKDRLAGNETGPEDVAFYRYESGAWRELPTQFVEEGDTHYFFEARSPGLSDFATGVKQAKFRITDAVVTVTRIRTHEGTDVLVRVRNVGGADGTYAVELLLADRVVDRRELSIAPNGTRQATFERSFGDPGTYRVFVNERFVANVTVEPVATSSPNATGTTGGEGSGGDGATGTSEGGGANGAEDGATGTGDGGSSSSVSMPGFGAAPAVLALFVAAILVTVRRLRW